MDNDIMDQPKRKYYTDCLCADHHFLDVKSAREHMMDCVNATSVSYANRNGKSIVVVYKEDLVEMIRRTK